MTSRGHGCKLSRKCHDAVLALLTEPTVKAAARRVGVSEKALRTWARIPEFAEMLREARDQAFGHALGRLQAVATQAVDVLERVMKGRKTSAELKVKAAAAVLTHSFKAAELHELADRLAALEARLAAEGTDAGSRGNSGAGAVNGRAWP